MMSFFCIWPALFRAGKRKFKLISWCVANATCVLTLTQARAEVEFDPIFLDRAAGDAIDISRFNGAYSIPAGTYDVDVYLNHRLLGRERVAVEQPHADDSLICFSQALIALTGFKAHQLSAEQQAALRREKSCVTLETLQPASRARLRLSDMRLDIHLPQAWLDTAARGYVDPALWQDGNNALYASYDNTWFRQKAGRYESESFYSKLGGGVNINGWMFRHSGALNWDADRGGSYTVFSNNLQRDITPLRSRVLIGDATTSGSLFDTFSFRGVQLATSEQMLPDSQRGYAPVVRGIAQTSARVSIRQNNALIYETTVPPGEFAINDIYPSGYGGDLQVTVTEADGRESIFSVPYASVAEMIRPGSYRYSLLLGTLRHQNISSTPKIFQATLQHGVNNWLTGYGGIMGTGDYSAALLGGAVGTAIGAFALDVTGARFDDGVSGQDGISLRASYNKFIAYTNSSISLAAYRFSSSGYLSLANATRLADLHRSERADSASLLLYRPQNRLSINVSQQLGEAGGSLYASGYVENYWDRQGSEIQYQLGYSNHYRSLNYGLSVNRSRFDSYAETHYLLSFSMPLGRGRPYINSYTTRSEQGIASQLGLSGVLGKRDELTYNLGVAREEEGAASGNVSAAYRFRNTQLKGSYAQGENYRAWTAGLSGSLVVLPDAWVASPYAGDTLAVVQAPGAGGASIEGYPGVIVNDAGYAMVPYLTPYRINKLALNPEGMPLDVELETTLKQVVPRAGAIVKVNYPTRLGNAVLIRAQLPDGEALPFGASVKTDDGRDVGVVAQGGQMYVRLDEMTQRLQVSWGADGRYICSFDVNLPPRKGRQQQFQRLTTTCRYPTATAAQDALAKVTQ